MKVSTIDRRTERGSASVKFVAIVLFIVLLANAGYNYIPVAYSGASFRQEMDVAVVKGLAASGQMKPVDVVKAHIQKATYENQIPSDAVIEITQATGHVAAHAAYEKKVNILPFGMYKYSYKFEYTATPQGYLLKE